MDMNTTASKPSPEGAHPLKSTFFKRHAPRFEGGAYKECLKNHAASMGGHALDGCGEFFPESTADPASLTCGACGCHRNFHRREPDSSPAPLIEYRPYHRHHPPPPPTMARGSHSPPPISSSYYPHMLLPLDRTGPNRKRFRSKFTSEQKEKMLELGEKLGWKMQKVNDDLVKKFCSDIGVERGVFKVWMHNNKNTLAKPDTGNENNNFQRESHFTGTGNGNGNGNGNSHSSSIEHQDHNGKSNGATNASSS